MKLSVPQEQLSRGLSIVGRGVASSARSTLPITSNILLATDEGRLRLSATDLEIGINLWVPAMVEQEGATTVPARLFTELVNSLPNERVDLAQTDEAHTTAVACARIKANIRGLDPDEFPLIPTRTLSELGRILPEGEEPVEVTVTPNRSQVLFHTGSLDLLSRLIEGQYVNYRQIIPQKYVSRAVVNTAEWKAATRIAGFFA